ncbi:MAG: signal peptidase II [Lachnospiraceae bacterium]|nr:signal peptidase II [Candidatus Colinaster scatohippi]
MINLILPAIIAGGDCSIKRHREENDEEYEYLNGKVKVVTYHNKGAFLNLGDKYPFVVLVLSMIFTFLIGILFVFSLGFKGRGILKAGLGLLLGGAFSNTYDRLKKGYVVDYLNFPHAPGKIRQIIFNISDFAIIIGSLMSIFVEKQ